MDKFLGWAACGLLVLLLGACVTHIEPSVTANPPPAEPLKNFGQFELLPVQASAEAKEETAALTKIQTNLQQKISAVTKPWERTEPNARKLKIEPYVDQLKFVDGGTRFFAGAFAGSSAVVIKLKLIDAATQQVIAQPEFFQRAAAMGGAWSVGGTDNGMLERIADVAQDYLRRNYDQAVGGPTGAEE
ncbi:hypothetical protein [Dongia sp. agr-C8]